MNGPDRKFTMTPELSELLQRMQRMLEPKINVAMTPELSESLERMQRMLEPKINVAMTPELSESLGRMQRMLEPKINVAMTPELSESLGRMQRMLEPKINVAMTPELSESLTRLSRMMAPTVNVPRTSELAGTALALSSAIEPFIGRYQAAFVAVQPSIDRLVARYDGIAAPDEVGEVQRRFVEEMAPSLSSIRMFNAQFHEALSADDMSALAEAIGTAGDLDDGEVEQISADLYRDDAEAALPPEYEVLADWVVLRKGLTGILALAVGAKWLGLHVDDPELAAMVDAVLASTGMTWSLYRFVNRLFERS
jgi:hypothetical protein